MELRKRLVLLVLLITLAGCQNSDSRGNGHQTNNSQQVVMYATSWCGYCQKAREFFARNDIDYIEYDIEESEEGRRQYQELGGRGVPLILVGTEKIPGWNAAAVTEALARLEASAPAADDFGQDSSLTAPDGAHQGMSTVKREVREEKSYVIHLRDGRKIKVKEYWETDDEIKCRRFGGIVGFQRNHVAVIENKVDGTRKQYNPFFSKGK